MSIILKRRVASASRGDAVSIDRDNAVLCISSGKRKLLINVLDPDRAVTNQGQYDLVTFLEIPSDSEHKCDFCILETDVGENP
jgi:hypothetical protein